MSDGAQPDGTGMSTVTDLPPLWVPLPEVPRWLRDMHGLTEAEAWNVLVYLRSWSFHFRVSFDTGENEILMSWNGWDVKDWKLGRAHWKDDPPDIDYPLGVSWDAVTDAVRMRTRQMQPPPPPNPSQKLIVNPRGGHLEGQEIEAVAVATASGARQKDAKPQFDRKQAKALMAAQKVSGHWTTAPDEPTNREFLLHHFKGVSNDPMREIRRELWPDIKTGPKPKPAPTAE